MEYVVGCLVFGLGAALLVRVIAGDVLDIKKRREEKDRIISEEPR